MNNSLLENELKYINDQIKMIEEENKNGNDKYGVNLPELIKRKKELSNKTLNVQPIYK